MSLSFGVAIAASPALAQQPAPPAPTPAAPAAPSAASAAEAKRHFDVGLKLYADGAFAEALVEFQTSYRLGGRPSALKNVAQCERDLKQYADAYEAQEMMLAVHGAQLKEPEKAAVRRALLELGELTGAIKVVVNEAGADVEIDGKSIGPSPLAASASIVKRVKLGSHKIRVTKEGFDPFEKEIAISSNQSLDVEAKLEHEVTTGHLMVREQQGDEVHVLVDGVDKGPAPWEGDLPAGEHTVEATGPKFASEKRAVTLARKQRLDLVVDATTTLGHVRVTTLPVNAAIVVDGNSVGTGAWEGDVAVGAHRIEVSAAGYPTSVRDVAVLRGQSIVQEIPLVAPSVPAPPEYRGFYSNLSISSAFALHSVAHVTSPSPSQGSVDTGKDIGFGTTLRIGYNFDILAIEFVGSGMFTTHNDSRNIPCNMGSGNCGSNDFQFQSFGFFVGAGARITSHDPTVRFTFGIAPGVAVRNFQVKRNNNGSSSPSPDPQCNQPGHQNCNMTTSGGGGDWTGNGGYAAPGLLMSGGMILGSASGAKFFLGMHAWMDLPPTITVGPDTGPNAPQDATYYSAPPRGYVAASGVQFYFGPVIGVQFGH